MLDLRLQFETIRDLRSEIVRNVAETKRRLLDVETRQSETVREVCLSVCLSLSYSLSLSCCQLLIILYHYIERSAEIVLCMLST